MKSWGSKLGSLAFLFVFIAACSDSSSKAGADAAAPGIDAAASADLAVLGPDAPSASRDLPPYDRLPPAPPISGHGWSHKEMGAGMLPAGMLGFEATSFGAIVRSAGTDIGGVADAAGFAFRRLKGDGEIIARVRSVQRASAASTAGLMVRVDENDPGSVSFFYGMLADAIKGAQLVVRAQKGGASVLHPNDPAARTGQHYLRIRREGRKLSAARSLDRVSWAGAGSVELDLPEELAFGLAATARPPAGMSLPTRGDFDSVRLLGFDARALQAGFALDTLVGASQGGMPEATLSLAGGTATLSSVGDQFSTTFEQGTALLAPTSGPVTLTARVESLGAAQTPNARVALTFRDLGSPRLAGNARNVLVSVTAAGKVQFQRRDRSTNFEPGASKDGLRPPLWLRLARYDDPVTFRSIVAGSYSVDGVTWTVLDAADYAVPDPTMAGVVMTSGVPETYASSRLTALAITATTGAPPPIVDAGAVPPMQDGGADGGQMGGVVDPGADAGQGGN